MKENYMEVYTDENGTKRIRGQFTVKDPNAKLNPDTIVGIAKEDVKKGQLVELTI